MMTCPFKFSAIFLMRSIDATDWARSKLNVGTPNASKFSRKWIASPTSTTGPVCGSLTSRLE
jgi:hypothetical protein